MRSRQMLRSSLVIASALLPAAAAEADIVVGPWTFADTAFADQATQVDTGSLHLWCAFDLNDALTGFSPDRQIVNIGLNSTVGNLFQLDFLDQRIVNAVGDDFVFFDSRFSADPYDLAVRSLGGSFTSFKTYSDSAFVDAGLGTCPSSQVGQLFGLAVNLDDFGLPPGAVVDAIRFRALPTAAGNVQGDPVMAASLSGCGACYGQGCPGAGGFTPSLTTNDPPLAGAQLSLVIDEAPGGATAFLFIGLGQGNVPMGAGCTLLLTPVLPAPLPIPLGGSGPGNGTATLVTVVPAGAAGVTVTLQAFVPDGASPTGFSNSNGLLLPFV